MSVGDTTSVSERVRAALDLFEVGEEMLRQRLRRERPGATDAEIEDAVAAWRTARPGAELGDGPGRLREWPLL